ncbi:glycerate kinase [Nocardioides anomalus]|uniref:Glycerate kinase n=1 Tax=Nocardioides anomalus TaxID=2712223 RepID=A0A6G6WJ47_9ACTN|nr:glycerate kinase [Nocardioides anomalus]QIG45163.1 glycerate kinase [Nocardioides anomalus]
MTTRRRVVVAPDKFKGSLSADQVAAVVARVLERHDPSVDVVRHPLADGGEGTVDLALASGYAPVTVEVTGPLGDPVRATFALSDGVAVLEAAAANGLALLPAGPDEHTAEHATTYGVGQLVAAALDHGATRVVVGVGGSATTDGGAGAVAALGLGPDAAAGPHPRLGEADLVVACDVDNPLTGPQGAAAVYALQKGAGTALVARLDERLARWADTVAHATGEDRRAEPGAGAAGGLAFGLLALAGARLVPGADLLLDLTGFDDVVRGADLVVVGEGSLDEQSLRGKGPVAAARRAAALGVPVVAVVGRSLLTPEQEREAGLSAVHALVDLAPDEQSAVHDAERLLERAAARLAADLHAYPSTRRE